MKDQPSVTEIITWHDVKNDLPDVETTVLLWGPEFEEIEIGFRDDDRERQWPTTDLEVTHWAHLPLGPEG